ncbi:hypothetical protein [Paenibacillus contaminans]|uniref:Uncharacterized protein n=1 Tax=Paenibacillus contaminans TaxID=450362 RepID=A0A329MLF7_9BACL|nr:hypothetical protein [Paenibacillus contaminans]RAV18707.1 hypothetical protein DQG23_23485 [Paenibacillus contaminans]
MLSFEEKLAILESFPVLQRKNVSLGRVNFHYEESVYEKKTVAYHLHPNGNGFVYVGQLPGYDADEKGLVNIRDYTEEKLRDIVVKSIDFLSGESGRPSSADGNDKKQSWTGPEGQQLDLIYENDLWFVYAGGNLESAFETREEAEEYLEEEGFSRA